jgi:hypothetical protein
MKLFERIYRLKAGTRSEQTVQFSAENPCKSLKTQVQLKGRKIILQNGSVNVDSPKRLPSSS